MITYDHHTLRLFGVPAFSIALGSVLLAVLAALIFGVVRWKHRSGKIALAVSLAALLLAGLVIGLVLLTVKSGSMG